MGRVSKNGTTNTMVPGPQCVSKHSRKSSKSRRSSREILEAAKNASQSPDARAEALDVDAKVLQICSMVAGGTFKRGESHQLLALEWGLSLQRVRELVAAAFRVLRLTRGDIDDEIEGRLQAILAAREIAANRVHYFAYQGHVVDERPEPDVGAMLQADRLYLEASGVMVRVRDAMRTLSGEEPVDMLEVIKSELEANPALVRSALSRLPPDDVRAILEKAGLGKKSDAPLLTAGPESLESHS